MIDISRISPELGLAEHAPMSSAKLVLIGAHHRDALPKKVKVFHGTFDNWR